MACVVACVLRYDGKVARVSASGSHDGLMRPPVGLRNRWLSKEGLKGAVVVVVFVGVFGAFGCCNLWRAARLVYHTTLFKVHFEIKIYDID